jgi:flagellar biosynthesis protein FlhB
MQPVRIKYYGLIPMTKQAYWICTVVAFIFAFAIVAIAALLRQLPPLSSLWELSPAKPAQGIRPFIYNHFYQIVVVGLVLEVIDIITTMRQFAKKEAERQVKPLDS